MAEFIPPQFRLITSSRGGNKLVENGFMYDKHKISGNGTYWQCERRSDCKARLHTDGMQTIKRINQHFHGPDIHKVSCLEVKAGIKQKAVQTQDSSHHISAEGVLSISDMTSVKLPKMNSLKRTIQRKRSITNSIPVQPQSLEELQIPIEFQRTAKNDVFLLYDSGPELRRILIFGTQRNVEMLKLAHIWLADGTFKTAPILFEQVYVIHALRGGPEPLRDGHLLPSLFVLLTNQQLCPLAQPTHMLMDFEKAAINSFLHYWPHTVVKGCFFHLTQNIFRKVQSEGLQNEYQQNPDFALQVKLLPALAFAPPFDVQTLFPVVVQNLPMPVTEGLVLYFERTYIGRTLPGGSFQQPIFPIAMWNYHLEALAGYPRTTNAVEAWLRSFNSTVGCNHPTIWKFIQALKLEQGLVEVKQMKFLAGEKPTKRVKWQHQEETHKNIIHDYLNRTVLEFLKGVAHHIGID